MRDKVAVIFGAGPGLGRTLAVTLAAEGAHVALAARTRASLDASAELVRGQGRRALVIPTDATDPEAVRSAADAVFAEFGRIDLVVNSLLPPHSFSTLAEQDDDELELWKNSIITSVVGAMYVIRFTAPYMIRAGQGSIVNVTATSALQGRASISHHVAGKAGIHGLSQSAAAELGPHGVRVNCVAPDVIMGTTVREFHSDGHASVTLDEFLVEEGAKTALGRIPTEEEVARAVMFLGSEAASGITGQILAVNGGQFFH